MGPLSLLLLTLALLLFSSPPTGSGRAFALALVGELSTPSSDVDIDGEVLNQWRQCVDKEEIVPLDLVSLPLWFSSLSSKETALILFASTAPPLTTRTRSFLKAYLTLADSIFRASYTNHSRPNASIQHPHRSGSDEQTEAKAETETENDAGLDVDALNAAKQAPLIRMYAVDCSEPSGHSLCAHEHIDDDTLPLVWSYTSARSPLDSTSPPSTAVGGLRGAKRYSGTAQIKDLLQFAFFSMPQFVNILPAQLQSVSPFAPDKKFPRYRVVLVSDKEKSEIPHTLQSLALRLQDERVRFFFANKGQHAFLPYACGIQHISELNVHISSLPLILVTKDVAQPLHAHFYHGPWSYAAMRDFVFDQVEYQYPPLPGSLANATATTSNPLLPELRDQSCLEKYCMNSRSSLCAVLIVSGSASDLSSLQHRFAALELSRADPVFKHVWLDSDKQSHFLLQVFGLAPAEYPQVVVLSWSKKRYSQFVGAFDNGPLAEWLRGLTSGKVRTAPLESTDILPLMSENATSFCFDDDDTGVIENVPTVHDGEKYVRLLTHENFTQEVLQSRAGWMLLFMQQSKDVEMVREPWLEVANRTRDAVRMAVILTDNEPSLVALFNVTETPTVFTIRGSLSGARTISSFKRVLDPITTQTLNNISLTLLDSSHIHRVHGDEGLNRFMTQYPAELSRILLVTKHTGSVPPIYTSLSLDYSNDLVFGIASASDQGLVDKFQVKKFPSLVAIGTLPTETGKSLQMIAGNFENALNLFELRHWCELVISEGVQDEHMPKEIKDRYRQHRQEGLARLQERRNENKLKPSMHQDL